MTKLRRRVSKEYDVSPSIGHQFNAELLGRYITFGNKLLDVGCWTGQLLGVLGEDRIDYYGVDVSKHSISLAKKSYPKAKFFLGSALDLPLKNNHFDVVVLFDVIEHLPSWQEKRCLEEIRRVIKTGGIFLLSTPADNFFSKIVDPAYFLIRHRHYKKETLSSLLKKCGFVPKEIWTVGSVGYASYFLIQMFFKHVFRATFPEWPVFSLIQKRASQELRMKKGLLTHYIVSISK